MQYLLTRQIDFLNYNSDGVTDCDLYNQIPGLFSHCIITGVNTFEELITADDGKSFFTRRYKDETYIDGINYIDLHRTFYKCQLRHIGDNVQMAFDCAKLWEDVVFEQEDIQIQLKTPIISLFRTFEGTKQVKIKERFHIKDVKVMSYCFYDCQYDIPNDFGKNILTDPSKLNFKTSWAWKENFPLLPRDFFVGFNVCDITECFASSAINSFNLQGQLFTEGGWWNGSEDVNFSTIDNLTLRALIHPIKVEEENEGEIITNYYLYPKAYTDVFCSTNGAYSHVTLPLAGDPNGEKASTLYLFQDSNTDLLLGRLPQLPQKNTTHQDYYTFLKQQQYVMQINKSKQFNNSSVMTNADYKQILPTSLFLVLNNFGFKNIKSIDRWQAPILLNEGYTYRLNHSYFNPTEATPGGIVPQSALINTLLVKLRDI